MCGIAGIYNHRNIEVSEDSIAKMTKCIAHRGPDFGSFKLYGNVALGHRRLSIIDLSNKANQPLVSDDNRYSIVYNGEVYNFQEIKDELLGMGISFNTTSDTEVVLKAYMEYGFSSFAKFNGMFAFAIYDNLKKELILVRDQFGIKPLYYFNDNNTFAFASEMKAILSNKNLQFSLNNQAVVEYIWFGNALGDNTIYNEILEVKPGCCLMISENGIFEKNYFDINNIQEIEISEGDALEQIKYLFDKSIKRHLISDVPVGVFLSGGIDSSAITAFASKHYAGKIKTYSVGFDYDKGINELALAKEVATKFNTDHHEVQITGKNLIGVIEDLVTAHDEPFGDAADIPLFLLTKNLKGSIKVVLQGDGGDEFFGGYSRYNTISKVKKWSFFSFLIPLISISRTSNVKALRLQRFLNAITEKKTYIRNALLLTMESKYSSPLQVFNKDFNKRLLTIDPFKKFKEVYNSYRKDMDASQQLFYTDTLTILKDTYFEKVDKSTMANSIEVRVPFLDKDLANFMLSLPASLKTKNGDQKYLLKKALHGIVPDNILYGKKKGFSVPYDYWLKTTLANYFEQQILSEKNKKYLDQKKIIKMFTLHKNDKGNFGSVLWKTLIFAVWVNKNAHL